MLITRLLDIWLALALITVMIPRWRGLGIAKFGGGCNVAVRKHLSGVEDFPPAFP